MKRVLCVSLLLVLLFVSILPLSAASLPQNKGVLSVMNAADAHMGQDTVGAAISVFESGTRTLSECFGYGNVEKRALVTAASGFELGELSGLFVALAVQALCDVGKMDLDADVTDYLPKPFVKKLDLSYTTTTRQLLHNTAGFEGRVFELSFTSSTYCFQSLEEALCAEIPKQVAAPGTLHTYSPFGVGLAAYVVECVSGMPYAEFVAREILEPLQMAHTFIDGANAPDVVCGHRAMGEGSFSVAPHAGRSYAGIYPATGAVSTQADMERLLSHLLTRGDLADVLAPTLSENGMFGAPLLDGAALSSGGYYLEGESAYFTASIALDPTMRSGALVLTNTRASTLQTISYTLLGGLATTICGSFSGAPELELFEGIYAPLSTEEDSLVGLLAVAERCVRVKLDEEGTLYFGDRPLTQLQPGVFAEVGENTPVLEFVYTIEGEVTGIRTVTGESYRPLSALRQRVVAYIFLGVVALLALYFLLGGLFSTWQAVRDRAYGERHPRAWRFVFPWIFAALQSILVLAQLLVARLLGNAAFASFFTAMEILTLLFAVGAVASLVFAAMTGFTERGRVARVMRTVMLYLPFLLLCAYWNLMLF